MTLEFNPSDSLIFQRPLIHTNKETLVLKNLNSEAVIFKIKTTAPKQYCVRPNAGRIDGLGQVEVEVILQPFKAEPPAYFQCKDKFLVQSAQIQRHYESKPATEIWHNLETQNPGAIHQQRIKCVFSAAMPSEETNPTAPTSNLAILHDKNGPAKVNEPVTATTPQPYSAQYKPQPPIPAPTTTTLSSACNLKPAENTAILSLSSSNGNDQINQYGGRLRRNQQHLSDICLRPSLDNGGPGKSSTNVQSSYHTAYQRLMRRLSPTTIEGSPAQVVLIMCAVISLVTYLFL